MTHPDTFWQAGLEHAVKIGLGNTEYELIILTLKITCTSDLLIIQMIS